MELARTPTTHQSQHMCASNKGHGKTTQSKRNAYHHILDEQQRRGFMQRTPTTNKTRGHYLCHYAVKKTSTTPLRIVYYCNIQHSVHASLNDCLDQGAPLLRDLGGILMRMCLFPTVMCADIEQAFSDIEL